MLRNSQATEPEAASTVGELYLGGNAQLRAPFAYNTKRKMTSEDYRSAHVSADQQASPADQDPAEQHLTTCWTS